MLKRYLASLLAALVLVTWAKPAFAAISLPFVFTPFTTISSSQVNADFSALSTNATDKRGDTLTGTLNTQLLQPSATATYDVGANATRYRDAYFSGQVNTVNLVATGLINTTGGLLTSGNITFNVDNTSDIGASGANRPRNIYAARNFAGPAEFDAGNSATAIAINFAANGPVQKVTRTGSATYTLTAPPSPQSVVLRMVHDGTASVYTVTFSPVPKYPNGTVPTYTNTSGAIDLVTLYWDGTLWYVFQQPNMS